MKVVVDHEFREICREIVEKYDRDSEASLICSDDEYQALNFCGGWVPHQRRFYFSYYAPDGGDYIFSFTLEEARAVVAGRPFDPPLTYFKEAPPTSHGSPD